MTQQSVPQLLIESAEVIDLANATTVPYGPPVTRRFEAPDAAATPLRISAEIRCDGVTGVPGRGCSVLFNLEYAEGPVFWDTFLYPDTGSTPWRRLSVDVRARGVLRAVEMKIQFSAQGRLRLRDLAFS
jgi:hypothetical protein